MTEPDETRSEHDLSSEKDIDRHIAHWTNMIDKDLSEHRYQIKLAEAFTKTDFSKAMTGWMLLIDKHPEEWKL